VLIVLGGFLLPAAALGCFELRSRLGFIGESSTPSDIAAGDPVQHTNGTHGQCRQQS
jgi:hypothetical protein